MGNWQLANSIRLKIILTHSPVLSFSTKLQITQYNSFAHEDETVEISVDCIISSVLYLYLDSREECFGGHKSFVGLVIPLFLTSGDISSSFQSQSREPYLHLAEVYIIHIP